MKRGRMPILACGPFLCLLLAACGNSSELSEADSQNLDNAAQYLDEASNILSNIDINGLDEPDTNLADEPGTNLSEPAPDEPA